MRLILLTLISLTLATGALKIVNNNADKVTTVNKHVQQIKVITKMSVTEYPFIFSIEKASMTDENLRQEFKKKVVVPQDCFVDQVTKLRIANNDTLNKEYAFGMWKCDENIKEFPKFEKVSTLKEEDFHFGDYRKIVSNTYGINGTFIRPNSLVQTCKRSRKEVIDEAKLINRLLIKRGEDRLFDQNLILSIRVVRMSFHRNGSNCNFMMNLNIFSTNELTEKDLRYLVEGDDLKGTERLSDEYGTMIVNAVFEDDFKPISPIKLCFNTYKVSMMLPEFAEKETLASDLTMLLSEALDSGEGFMVVRPLNLEVEDLSKFDQQLASFNLFVTCHDSTPSAERIQTAYKKYFSQHFPNIKNRVYSNVIGVKED